MTREEFAASKGFDPQTLPVNPLPEAEAERFPITREVDLPHHASIEQALSEGKPVSPEVLKDYPDLQPKAVTPPENPPGTTPIPPATPAEPGESQIIQMRNVGPDTTQAVQAAADALREIARPGVMKKFWNDIQDRVSIEPVPRLARIANWLADKAVEHASARIAAPKMVNGLLSSIFPNSYRNAPEMAKTIGLIIKDNILGIWDGLNKRAQDAKAVGEIDAGKMEQKAATAVDAEMAGKYQAQADAIRKAADTKADDWSDKAHALAREHDIDAYDAQVKAERDNPTVISDNIARWKQFWSGDGQLMERLFNEMKRVDPETQREGRGRYFDARINLTSEARAREIAEYLGDEGKPAPEPVQTGYLNPNVPKDKFDRMATGTGQYSTDARLNLLNSLVGRWNKVTELRFYDALAQSGAGVLLKQGESAPDQIQGQSVASFPVKMPYTEITGEGVEKTTRVNYYTLAVRQDLASEVRGVLNIDTALKQSRIARILTTIQIAQLADAMTHIKNIQTVISRAQGAGAAWRDIIRKMPILNTLDAWYRIASVAMEIAGDSPAIRDEIASMAEKGLIRPEYPAQGLQAITHGGEMIHAVDTAARVLMNRFFDNMVERGADPSDANRRQFINQVGMYNRRLMAPWMRAAKDSGISPFIVAGRNFNRQGWNAVTGNPMLAFTDTGAAIQARAMNLFGTAMVMSVIPMIWNTLRVGTPMGRPGTPIGALDLGFDEDEKGQHSIVDLADLIGLRRGMRFTGLNAVIEGLHQGHTAGQIAGQAGEDIRNSVLHPWEGPGVGFGLASVFGLRTDLRGNMEATKYPGDAVRQHVEYARAALASQNPLVYSLIRPAFQAMGLDQGPGKPYGENLASTFLKSPSAVVGLKNVYPARSAASKWLLIFSVVDRKVTSRANRNTRS